MREPDIGYYCRTRIMDSNKIEVKTDHEQDEHVKVKVIKLDELKDQDADIRVW